MIGAAVLGRPGSRWIRPLMREVSLDRQMETQRMQHEDCTVTLKSRVAEKHKIGPKFISIGALGQDNQVRVTVNFPSYLDKNGESVLPSPAYEIWKLCNRQTCDWLCVKDASD